MHTEGSLSLILGLCWNGSPLFPSLFPQATVLSSHRSFLSRLDLLDVGNPNKATKGDPLSMFLFSDSIEVGRGVIYQFNNTFGIYQNTCIWVLTGGTFHWS